MSATAFLALSAQRARKARLAQSVPGVQWYARLSGYGGSPTTEVYGVPAQSVQYDDDGEPFYHCYTEIAPYSGECDGEPCTSVVYFDYLYRRCAPIGRDKAYEITPALVAYTDADLATVKMGEN